LRKRTSDDGCAANCMTGSDLRSPAWPSKSQRLAGQLNAAIHRLSGC
jgi:hypothetical protein